MGRRSFAGSLIGGIRETQEMLDFCGEHNLGADIELIPVDKVNDAYDRVLASDVRYRFVIDTSTLH
jgi:alcohol dehydrogenase (NADP+)